MTRAEHAGADSGDLFAPPRFVTDLTECTFYHVMDIPGYGTPDAPWDLRGQFHEYIGHVDVSGKRVLDVGCASGFLSFSAEQAGAREVVSFDMDHGGRQHFLPFRGRPYYDDYTSFRKEHDAKVDKWKNAYWLAHRCFKSHAKAYYGDVYNLPLELGLFDVVIVGAVLEHLSDPIRALASIAKLTSATLVISTDFVDTEEPIARFMGRAGNPDIDYVFWSYSLGVYREVLAMLGFRIDRVVTGKFRFAWRNDSFDRHAIVAVRN